MIKALLFLLSFFALNASFGQQDKQLTHYTFDRMSFNPAATGFKGYCGTLIYRNQWDRVQDAPNTTLLNLQGNIPNQNIGVGVSLSNDVLGFQKTNSAILNGAYHLRTKAGTLSAGIGLGIINVGFSPDWVPPQTMNDPLLPDALSASAFDVNAGLYWHATHAPYYVGISSTHLAPQTLTNIYFKVARHYYVLAGYDFTLSTKRQIVLKPSVLVKADGATAIFDVNMNADIWINSKTYFWSGLTYRLQDAIALSAGIAFSPEQIAIPNMVKIGYSFDVMTNPLNTYGRGTHELMLNVCLFPPPPPRTRHGNPFILD
jgi:type IX secretion system PorP/SprF family membrane protein